MAKFASAAEKDSGVKPETNRACKQSIASGTLGNIKRSKLASSQAEGGGVKVAKNL